MNQYESELMDELLCADGHTHAAGTFDADICIVNSCTVTATGDAKCRKYINRIRRENPSCIIVLCGCMPQAFSDEPELFRGCDIVLGNTERRNLTDAIDEYLRTHQQLIRITSHTKDEPFEPMQVHSFHARTRAYIKIEDGCNRFCSYCIIPYARGRVRSKPLSVLAAEAADLVSNGYREIVLVGINLSAYGSEFGADIYDAVHTVCVIEGVERVRLSSIEPERMDEQMLCKLSKEKKFCPHFHLSLQSGCDATLQRMRRHYTTAEYRKIVDDIRRLFDNPSVTTDVMVGFVSESDEEFSASLKFCTEIGFAKTHVFSYSRRKGTAADKLDGHVDERTKGERSARMIAAMAACEREFLLTQVGRTVNVLFEQQSKDGLIEGYAENYTKVRVRTDRSLLGMICPVILTDAYNNYCVGELVR